MTFGDEVERKKKLKNLVLQKYRQGGTNKCRLVTPVCQTIDNILHLELLVSG